MTIINTYAPYYSGDASNKNYTDVAYKIHLS